MPISLLRSDAGRSTRPHRGPHRKTRRTRRRRLRTPAVRSPARATPAPIRDRRPLPRAPLRSRPQRARAQPACAASDDRSLRDRRTGRAGSPRSRPRRPCPPCVSSIRLRWPWCLRYRVRDATSMHLPQPRRLIRDDAAQQVARAGRLRRRGGKIDGLSGGAIARRRQRVHPRRRWPRRNDPVEILGGERCGDGRWACQMSVRCASNANRSSCPAARQWRLRARRRSSSAEKSSGSGDLPGCLLARHGVDEPSRHALQGLPLKRDRIADLAGSSRVGLREFSSVRGIADQRMPDGGEVHTDLMRAAGFEPTENERAVAESLAHLVVRHGVPARGHARPSTSVSTGWRPMGASTVPLRTMSPAASARYSRRTLRACSCRTRSVCAFRSGRRPGAL